MFWYPSKILAFGDCDEGIDGIQESAPWRIAPKNAIERFQDSTFAVDWVPGESCQHGDWHTRTVRVRENERTIFGGNVSLHKCTRRSRPHPMNSLFSYQYPTVYGGCDGYDE